MSTMPSPFKSASGFQLLVSFQGVCGLFSAADPKAIASSYAMPPNIWPGQVRIIVSPFIPLVEVEKYWIL